MKNGHRVDVPPYATDGDVDAPSRSDAETVRDLLAPAGRSDMQPASAATLSG